MKGKVGGMVMMETGNLRKQDSSEKEHKSTEDL